MKYNNYVGRRKRRAVAPIIATLLMVAIAVVGGVMIYVFTQGFFKGTSTSTPTTDILSVTGYDMKSTQVYTYDGTGGALGGVTTAATGIATNDKVAIDVKNSGTTQLTITAVKVGGVGAKFKNAAPGNGEFGVYTKGAWSTTGQVDAGQVATIVYSYGGATTLTAGTAVSVDIITANGAFAVNEIPGERH